MHALNDPLILAAEQLKCQGWQMYVSRAFINTTFKSFFALYYLALELNET